jgi:hypothetical protein
MLLYNVVNYLQFVINVFGNSQGRLFEEFHFAVYSLGTANSFM